MVSGGRRLALQRVDLACWRDPSYSIRFQEFRKVYLDLKMGYEPPPKKWTPEMWPKILGWESRHIAGSVHEILWLWMERRVSLHQGGSWTLAVCPGGLFNADSDLFVSDFWREQSDSTCGMFSPVFCHYCQWPSIGGSRSNSYWLQSILETSWDPFLNLAELLEFLVWRLVSFTAVSSVTARWQRPKDCLSAYRCRHFQRNWLAKVKCLFLSVESARCQLVRRRIYRNIDNKHTLYR